MNAPYARPLLALLVTASLGLGFLPGCNEERKVKECAERCAHEGEACAHRHEQGCEERGKRCAAHCDPTGEFRF